MSADVRFETLLTDWLDETASVAGASALHEQAMTGVLRTRPRPAWRVVLSGGSMGSSTPRLGRAGRTTVYLLVLLGLILALVAVAIVGSRPSAVVPPPPYGLADNGAITFGQDGDIFQTQRDGSDPRPLIADEAIDGYPLYSPDGTRFIFDRTMPDGRHMVMVANADGGDPRPIAEVPSPFEDWTWTDWAPDSESLVVMWAGPGRRVLSILHVNGDPPTTIDLGDLVPYELASWRPPGGEEIIFEANAGGLGLRGVYAIKPDGTGLRAIGDISNDCRDCMFQQPALSPNGANIAFSSWETDEAGVSDMHLYLRDLDTGEDQPLSLDSFWPWGGMLPRYTPDGDHLVFESAPHTDAPGIDTQLVIAPLDASVPALALGQPYAGGDGGDRESFDISPDGKTVILDLAGVTWLIDTATGKATQAPVYMPNQPSWQRR